MHFPKPCPAPITKRCSTFSPSMDSMSLWNRDRLKSISDNLELLRQDRNSHSVASREPTEAFRHERQPDLPPRPSLRRVRGICLRGEEGPAEVDVGRFFHRDQQPQKKRVLVAADAIDSGAHFLCLVDRVFETCSPLFRRCSVMSRIAPSMRTGRPSASHRA